MRRYGILCVLNTFKKHFLCVPFLMRFTSYRAERPFETMEEPDMEDSQIIDLYFARDEQAVVQTEKKYGKYCLSLAGAILSSEEDAEEVVNDTYWKTWEAIPPRRPVVFRLFLAKITRNLAFTRWRTNTAEKRGGTETALVLDELSDCIPGSDGPEAEFQAKELSAAIRTFLDTLSPRDQDLFLRRYFFVETTEAIAARYSMRPETVRRALSRSRMKLKNYLIQEGYGV